MFRAFILLAILLGSFQAMNAAYTIDVSKSTQTLKAKEHGLFIVSVKIEPEVQLNQEAPIELVLEKNLKLQFTKTTLNKTGNAFQFQIPFQAITIGKQAIKGELRFFLCRANTCTAIKESLSHNVEVNAY